MATADSWLTLLSKTVFNSNGIRNFNCYIKVILFRCLRDEQNYFRAKVIFNSQSYY